MEKEYVELLKRVDEIEKEFGSLENFAILSTCVDFQHTLGIGGDFDLTKVYDDLVELEIADLVDYQNLKGEYGERF